MSELLPKENGFMGKKGPTVKILPITKTPILHSRQFLTKVHLKMSLVYKVSQCFHHTTSVFLILISFFETSDGLNIFLFFLGKS